MLGTEFKKYKTSALFSHVCLFFDHADLTSEEMKLLMYIIDIHKLSKLEYMETGRTTYLFKSFLIDVSLYG